MGVRWYTWEGLYEWYTYGVVCGVVVVWWGSGCGVMWCGVVKCGVM